MLACLHQPEYMYKLLRKAVKNFLMLTAPDEKTKCELLQCPVAGCNSFVFDGTTVGPKQEEMPPEHRYEPKTNPHNGMIKVVDSRTARMPIKNEQCREYMSELSGLCRSKGKDANIRSYINCVVFATEQFLPLAVWDYTFSFYKN